MRNKRLLNEMEPETRCHDCGGRLPKGTSELSFYCRTIGLCQYCYRHKYPRRGRPKWPAISQHGQKLLSYSERRKWERKALDTTFWTPEFYAEWIEYWKSRGGDSDE